MTGPAPRLPLRLKEMTPADVRHALTANPRMILPVGTCEQHGPHLPLGGDTMVIERLADDLSAEFQVVRAPTVEFGVNDRGEIQGAGAASVRRKTLRRWLNDLVPDWEHAGIAEIIILTMNGFTPHQEALGTIVADRARVRVIDVLALDFGTFAEHPDDQMHGGEIDTSLVLYVRPDLVRMDAAYDCILPESDLRRYRRGSSLRLPVNSLGSVGRATSASADKGRRMYQFILDRIRERVFGANPAAAKG
jgi:creatinine amidohydrolase